MSYTGPEAAQIVGVTYRQVDYWERTDLVTPSLRPAQGSGTRRSYSYRDLVELRIVRAMLDSGMTLNAARDVIHTMQGVSGNLAELALVVDDSGSRCVDTDQLVEIVRSGTSMLNVLPLAGVLEALDSTLHTAASSLVAG